MATPYQNSLYQASFRGAPFGVYEAGGDFGRKLAEHDYPFRDANWAEDLGRKPREFDIRGFLIGDDVLAQVQYMISLVEQAGAGMLVHPTLGICNVVVIGFHTQSTTENGREIELQFRLKEAGSSLFPSAITNGLGAIGTAIDSVFGAGSADFVSGVITAVQKGASVVAAGVQTITTVTAAGGALTKGATNLTSQVSSLTGNFGRYSSGATGSGSNSVNGPVIATGQIATQVQGLIGQGSAARAGVSSAGGGLLSAVEAL